MGRWIVADLLSTGFPVIVLTNTYEFKKPSFEDDGRDRSAFFRRFGWP
ncbi:hypothetical protein IMPR6_180037 [Imperialibacter sp. EC-SDR9]|nr:hypothetical protein IMPR6_180037 [Imperialibacter sp. EC-SDR9]